MAAELVFPVVGQHPAVLRVVAAMREVEFIETQRQAEALGHRAQHAQPLGHHLLANAVTGDHRDLLHHNSWWKNSMASASTTSGASSAM